MGKKNKKPVFLWDYLRNGNASKYGSPFAKIAKFLDRNDPEKLTKRRDALLLKQDINRIKDQTEAERRIGK